MKRYEKLCSCLMIVALCIAGMALGGCKKARVKRHNLSVATGAVVNSMMMTNPLGLLFGDKSQTQSEQGVRQNIAAIQACPAITFEGILLPPISYSQEITITYDSGCLVNGLAMSGTIAGAWSITKDSEEKIYFDTQLTIDNLTMEGLVTDGHIHQMLYIGKTGPYAYIAGDMTTTHADGRSRSLVYDNLTAEVDLSGWITDILNCDNATVPNLVINGSATYIDENNSTFAADFDNVTQPFNCPMPVSGTLHLVNTDEDIDALIDYGEGVCDNLVTITINDEEPKVVDVTEYLNKHQYRF